MDSNLVNDMISMQRKCQFYIHRFKRLSAVGRMTFSHCTERSLEESTSIDATSAVSAKAGDKDFLSSGKSSNRFSKS